MNALRQFKASKAAADAYLQDVLNILYGLPASAFIEFSVADDDDDRKRATDILCSLASVRVGWRVRQDDPRYRADVAFRHSRASGAPTEFQKLVAGYPDLCIYLWASDGAVVRHVVIDCDRLRSSGLLEDPRIIPTPDGGTLAVVALDDLRARGCIIAER